MPTLAPAPSPRKALAVRILVAVLALAATANALLRTSSYGAAVGMDEIMYLSAAENLAAGEGLTQFNLRPLRSWLPFFSVLMAGPIWLGATPEEAGRWLNATLFGLIVLITGLWLCANVRSRTLVVIATAAVALAKGLNHLATTLLSEIVFTFFTLLALLQLVSFLREGREDNGRSSWWKLLSAALCAGLAGATRYAGTPLILFGPLVLLLAHRDAIRARMAYAGLFAAIAAAPLVLFSLRNSAASRLNLDGPPIWEQIGTCVDALRRWAIPEGTPHQLEWLLWSGVVLTLASAAALLLARHQASDVGHACRTAGILPSRLLTEPPVVLGAFVLIYASFIVAMQSAGASSGASSVTTWSTMRFLTPIYPLVVCIWALLAQCLMPAAAFGRYRVAARCVLATLLLGAILHTALAARICVNFTIRALQRGAGESTFNSAYYARHQTLNYLCTHPVDGPVYSVHSALLWWRSGLPASAGQHHQTDGRIADLVRKVKDKPHDSYFVWVKALYRDDTPYHQQIHLMPGFEPVAQFPDGGVYRVPAGWRFDADEWQRRLRQSDQTSTTSK